MSAKLELLEAVVATGVREIEATAFVSPSKVPALADAAALAAELPRFRESHGVEFSALVAGPGGAGRAIAAGMGSIEYVVSAADGAQPRQRRAVDRRVHRPDRRHRPHRPRERRDDRGDHRDGMGLPVRRAHRPAARARRRHGRRRDRRRPDRHRRHHRHHHAAAGDRADRTAPAGDRRHCRSAPTSTTPAAPDWPAPTPPSARASTGWTRRSAGSAAARSPPAPAATSPPRTWCTCCATAASASTSTCRPRSTRQASRAGVVGHDLPSALLRAGDRILG